MKKGQISYFIIIGIIILMAFIAMFLLKSYDFKTPFAKNQNPEVKSCIEFVGADAIKLIALRGGDLTQQNKAGNITLILSNDQKLFRTKEQIEEQISDYIETHIQDCIESKYPDYITLTFGQPTVKTTIYPVDVRIEMALDLSIQEGSTITSKSNFNGIVRSDLNSAIEIIDITVESILQTGKVNEDILANAPFKVKAFGEDTIFIFESNYYDFVFGIE